MIAFAVVALILGLVGTCWGILHLERVRGREYQSWRYGGPPTQSRRQGQGFQFRIASILILTLGSAGVMAMLRFQDALADWPAGLVCIVTVALMASYDLQLRWQFGPLRGYALSGLIGGMAGSIFFLILASILVRPTLEWQISWLNFIGYLASWIGWGGMLGMVVGAIVGRWSFPRWQPATEDRFDERGQGETELPQPIQPVPPSKSVREWIQVAPLLSLCALVYGVLLILTNSFLNFVPLELGSASPTYESVTLEVSWYSPSEQRPNETFTIAPSNPVEREVRLQRPNETVTIPPSNPIERDATLAWKTYAEAKEFAQKTNRALFVVVTSKIYPTLTQKVHEEILTQPSVIRKITAQFIACKLDTEEQPEVCQQLEVRGLPCLLILEPDGNVSYRGEGSWFFTEYLERLK